MAGGGYKGAMTGFIVNNTQYTHEYTKTTYKLVNFQPIGNGLFLVTYGGNQAPIYVIGWADEIWIDSVQQTGLGL